MIESLESRQFLSATLMTEALSDTAPATSTTVDGDEAAVERKVKPATKPQTYMTVTMTDLLVTS
jgi:hypothetical protein